MLKPPKAMRTQISKRSFCNHYGLTGIPPAECGCTECSDVHACIVAAKMRAYDDNNPHI